MFEGSRQVVAAHAAQVARFGAVGVLSNLVYFAALALACPLAGLPLWLGSALAYAVSMALNYLMQRRVTFQSERPHGELLLPYVAVQLASLALNSALLALLVTHLDLHFAVGQTVALIATTTLNFVCQKLWVFRHRPRRSELPPGPTQRDLSA